METGAIHRSALGSVAKLGDLYDARYDKFCGISILKESAPSSAIQSRDNPFQDTKFLYSDKYSDNFEKLDVKAELKLSVMCDLLTLEGSARYFKDKKSSKRAARCTLMHNILTKVEELSIYNDQLKGCIAMDALRQDATHVVVGINWGANLMVTAEYSNSEEEEKMVVEGMLQAQLKKLAFSISGKAEVDYGEGGSSKKREFSLHIYGDVLPDGDLPQTIEGAAELMKRLPALIKEANDGKGKPLHYTLLPLNVLTSYFKIEMAADNVAKTLGEEAILRFVHLFDHIRDVKQQLNDLHTDVLKYDMCLYDNTRKRVEDLKRNADITEAALRSELAKLLVKVRSGRADASELESLRQRYEDGPHTAQNVLNRIRDEFAEIHEKIKMYKLLTVKYGVNFVNKSEKSLHTTLLEYPRSDAYVLFFQSKAQLEDKDLWSKQIHLFLSLMEEEKSKVGEQGKPVDNPAVFLYVDVDVAPELLPEGDQAIVIQHFKNGKPISANLAEDYAKAESLCLVKPSEVIPTVSKPNKRTALELKCPASMYGQCESDAHKWICFKCETEVEYGFDDYFYCKCGKGKANTYSFRCNSKKHGTRSLMKMGQC